MNKKAILLKAAMGIYRVKTAESDLPDPVRERMKEYANKNTFIEALKGALTGSLVGAGVGGMGSGMVSIGNGMTVIPGATDQCFIPAVTHGALLGAPVGGLIGGIRSYLRAADNARNAQETLDVDEWNVRRRKEQKDID